MSGRIRRPSPASLIAATALLAALAGSAIAAPIERERKVTTTAVKGIARKQIAKLEQITEPGAALTAMDYDAAGNLTSATDPERGVRAYTYDSSNRLTSFTDERSRV